jgi:hypothetical protein
MGVTILRIQKAARKVADQANDDVADMMTIT